MSREKFRELEREVRRLQASGELPVWPTNEQRADWAYGNTVIENENVTREIATLAAINAPAPRR